MRMASTFTTSMFPSRFFGKMSCRIGLRTPMGAPSLSQDRQEVALRCSHAAKWPPVASSGSGSSLSFAATPGAPARPCRSPWRDLRVVRQPWLPR